MHRFLRAAQSRAAPCTASYAWHMYLTVLRSLQHVVNFLRVVWLKYISAAPVLAWIPACCTLLRCPLHSPIRLAHVPDCIALIATRYEFSESWLAEIYFRRASSSMYSCVLHAPALPPKHCFSLYGTHAHVCPFQHWLSVCCLLSCTQECRT